MLDEVFGLGPLEPLLKDPTISDIMVNGFDNVYVERAGQTGGNQRPLQGSGACAHDHRPHRFEYRPPHRRFFAHRGRAPRTTARVFAR